MHHHYEEKLKQKADFRVRYRFYTKEEGGRKTTPYQGYRSDFWYPHKGGNENSVFMIYPEFEDANGNIVLENDKAVNEQGTARMWVIMPKMREYHKPRIIKGTKGYFMEGSRKVAECEVIEIIDLLVNPTE
jgi:hypothetical protein